MRLKHLISGRRKSSAIASSQFRNAISSRHPGAPHVLLPQGPCVCLRWSLPLYVFILNVHHLIHSASSKLTIIVPNLGIDAQVTHYVTPYCSSVVIVSIHSNIRNKVFCPMRRFAPGSVIIPSLWLLRRAIRGTRRRYIEAVGSRFYITR